MKWLVVGSIRIYQKYFRWLHNRSCIYTPTCSDYTIIAVEKYGMFKGLCFGLSRVRRCNGAMYRGGEDFP